MPQGLQKCCSESSHSAYYTYTCEHIQETPRDHVLMLDGVNFRIRRCCVEVAMENGISYHEMSGEILMLLIPQEKPTSKCPDTFSRDTNFTPFFSRQPAAAKTWFHVELLTLRTFGLSLSDREREMAQARPVQQLERHKGQKKHKGLLQNRFRPASKKGGCLFFKRPKIGKMARNPIFEPFFLQFLSFFLFSGEVFWGTKTVAVMQMKFPE